MAEKILDQERTEKTRHRKPMFNLARHILLAGVGAMALAQDEIEDFVDKLIERGEIAEKEGRSLIQEIKQKRQKRVERAEDDLGRRVEDILARLNIPSKADFETLSKKINTLTKKVEEIKKDQA
ncbi:MAG: phasin family protein [Anaerolineales bacterium]|nr:MAG: phasin family protein [Anaerolineales bacterium]